jgi:RND family efflux transporter MFP subunit
MIHHLALVGSFLLLAACAGGPADPPATTTEESVQPIPVHVQAVGPGTIETMLRTHGRLRETRRHRVVILTEGVVADLPLRQGDPVTAGALLVRLDPLPETEVRRVRVQATAERARRELDRRLAIAAKAPEAVSGSDLDRLRDACEDADLEVETLSADRDRRTVTAPLTGILDSLDLIPGQRVTAGTTVGEIVATGPLELPINLPETALGRLAVGQEVRVETLDGGTTTGTVLRLPALIDPTQGTGEVLVGIASPPAGWRSGAYATATCLLERIEAPLVLPRRLVQYHRNRSYTWIVAAEGDRLMVKKAWLELGAGDDDRVAVSAGLTAGDRVVTDTVGIREYLQVEIAPTDPTDTPPPKTGAHGEGRRPRGSGPGGPGGPGGRGPR